MGLTHANKSRLARKRRASAVVEISDVDRAILAEVTMDPFASNAAVAEKLGLSTSMVSSRLRILHRDNVSQILAVLDLDHMKQTFCFIYVQIRDRPIAEIAEEISSRRLALLVAELTNSTADLLVLLRFDDIHTLNTSLFGDLARIAGISSWRIDIVVDVPIFRSEYVTFGPQHRPMEVEKSIEYLKDDIPEGMCDEIDLQIIAHLQLNAHQSINNIARTLNIKPSTARYRINNLKNSDILRFVRVIDHSMVGIETFAIFEIDIDIGLIDSITNALRNKSWLPQLFHCAGGAALVGIILAKDIDHVLSIKRLEIMNIPGIKSVAINYLNKTYHNDYRWAQSTR